MDQELEIRLAEQLGPVVVEGRLHAVPPHEVYELDLEGRRAVLKRDAGPTGRAGVEGRVIDFVGRQTSVPVPEILHVGPDYFVADWAPLAPGPNSSSEADESWARAAGKGLATLHAETAPAIDGYGVFREDGSGLAIDDRPNWPDAIGEYLDQRREALSRYGHGDIVDSVAAFFADQPGRFEATGGPVCCHGWASPEHVAVDDGTVACMIDFEHAIAAPGEFDVWRTLLPVFGRTSGDPGRTAFLAGYETVRPLPDGFERREPLYRLLHAVYFLESLHVQAQHGPAQTSDRAERLRDTIRSLLAELR